MRRCRAAAKSLHKDDYPEVIKEYVDMIKKHMAASGTSAERSTLELRVSNTFRNDGMARMMFDAALCEIIDQEKKAKG